MANVLEKIVANKRIEIEQLKNKSHYQALLMN